MLSASLREKLNKSGRTYRELDDPRPCTSNVELFCENCRKSMGNFNIYYTDFDKNKFCPECVQKYIKPVPNKLDFGIIIEDNGNTVTIQYPQEKATSPLTKVCYFNKNGRYIKYKSKRYYI